MTEREIVVLERDCRALRVPDGTPIVIPEGSEVRITQALGGSFTVQFEGNLARIAAEEAGALGKEPQRAPQLGEDAADDEVEAAALEQLRTVYDPEIPVNIVDLGLVYVCRVEDAGGRRRVYVEMTLTAPGCGMGEVLTAEAKGKLEAIAAVDEARVELVFDPPWGRERMSEAARLQLGLLDC